MYNLLRNFLREHLYAISIYVRQISGTLILFVIARYLSVYDYGLFSSYKSIAIFCLMLANLGYNEYILVSAKANIKEVKLKISLFLINAFFIILLSTLCSLFFKMDSHFLFMLVLVRTFFDGTFFSLILPYFQASKKFQTIGIINIIYALLISMIALISLLFKLSLVKFLLLNITLGVINFIQCSYYANINFLLPIIKFYRYLKMIDKSILAYVGVTIAYFLYAQIPSLYVSTMLTKEDAALYFAAYTISNVVLLFSGAQIQKIVPEMIKCSIAESKSIIKKNLKLIFIISVSIIIFIALFGKILLTLLYGQSYYSQANIILLLMMIANACCAEGAVYGAYITASGRQNKKIPIQIETSVITVIGLFVFSKLGILAPVITFLCSAIYISTRYIIFTNKCLIQDLIKEKNNE